MREKRIDGRYTTTVRLSERERERESFVLLAAVRCCVVGVAQPHTRDQSYCTVRSHTVYGTLNRVYGM